MCKGTNDYLTYSPILIHFGPLNAENEEGDFCNFLYVPFHKWHLPANANAALAIADCHCIDNRRAIWPILAIGLLMKGLQNISVGNAFTTVGVK